MQGLSLLLIISITICTVVNVSAQKSDKNKVSIKIKGATLHHIENGAEVYFISMSKLRKLKVLETSEKQWKVKSYIFVSILPNATLKERHVTGNSFKECFRDIAEAGYVSFFLLEKIILVNNLGEEKVLLPIKVKLKP